MPKLVRAESVLHTREDGSESKVTNWPAGGVCFHDLGPICAACPRVSMIFTKSPRVFMGLAGTTVVLSPTVSQKSDETCCRVFV
jgi:hypothetical protein